MPSLSRGAATLWQELWTSFHYTPPASARPFRNFGKHAPPKYFCTQPQQKLPEPGSSGTDRLSQHRKREIQVEKSGDSFFSGHHVNVKNTSGEAVARPLKRDKKQDASALNIRRLFWGSSPQIETSEQSGFPRNYQQLSRNGQVERDESRTSGGGSLETPRSPLGSTNLHFRTRDLRARQGRPYSELNGEELHEELRKTSTAGDYPRVREILRILVRELGERPSRRHYQALLLVNTSPQHGSAAQVARILLDMEEAGITLDSAAYHAVLKVLAIHPDYVLRRHILEELRQRWFTLSVEGWHCLIAGLVRDKQVEHAISILQSAQQVEIRIEPWLYDMLSYNLCDVSEFDETLSILRLRVDSGEQFLSGTVWYYLLDTASSAFQYSATLYAWRKRVETNYLNPSSGMCLNVLNTAARHGDFHLATDVVRVLGDRNQSLELYHYEALIESCLPSDLRTAMMLLTLMSSIGVSPMDSSTRPIFLHLRQSPRLPLIALSILRKFREQDRPIPIEAVNVVIESYIYHAQLDAALDIYQTLHDLCPPGPSTSTFNRLLNGCRGRKDTAMFLASEMVALKVAPNALTYDNLILVCIESSRSDDMDDAWRYFEEMRGAGWRPRARTAMAMAQRCCQSGDDRIWQLQREGQGDDGVDKSVLDALVDAKGMKEMARHTESRNSDMKDAGDQWS